MILWVENLNRAQWDWFASFPVAGTCFVVQLEGYGAWGCTALQGHVCVAPCLRVSLFAMSLPLESPVGTFYLAGHFTWQYWATKKLKAEASKPSGGLGSALVSCHFVVLYWLRFQVSPYLREGMVQRHGYQGV